MHTDSDLQPYLLWLCLARLYLPWQVHTDYDLQLTPHPAALWCLGQNAPQGVATFHFPCLTDR